MEPDKKPDEEPTTEPPKDEPAKDAPAEEPKETPVADESKAPSDALSRTPEDLAQEETAQAAANGTPVADDLGEKKVSAFKKLFRKVNIYFLFFLLLVVVAGIITAVNYFNSQKAPVTPSIASQTLNQDALKQLANTDATVGDTSQTLTIQGNAIIAGQTLTRGNLNVAGSVQTSSSIQGASLTVGGAVNLGSTQINSLQVATNTAIQGTTTLHDLNVSGVSAFSGAVTAGQLTVTKLILSGNAVLQIPNHISFTGSSPNRTINTAVLGSGGSTSLNGSDTSGSLSINTGNGPVAGCFVRITFQQVYTNPPHVLISPVGQAAGETEFYVTRDTAGFSVCTANAAPANAAFGYDYFVTN